MEAIQDFRNAIKGMHNGWRRAGMIQFIQEKNMLRLRVVLLFMATLYLQEK